MTHGMALFCSSIKHSEMVKKTKEIKVEKIMDNPLTRECEVKYVDSYSIKDKLTISTFLNLLPTPFLYNY